MSTEARNRSNEVEEDEEEDGRVTCGVSLALLDTPELIGILWPIMAFSGSVLASARDP